MTSSERATYTTRLIGTIFNNLVVNVQGIHIRYEDASSSPSHPFACGLTLENFAIQTTDSSFQPIPVHTTTAKLHKCVALTRFGVYWRSDHSLAADRQGTIEPPPPDEDFLLHPVTVTLHVQIVNSPATAESKQPRLTVDATVDCIALSFSPAPARDAQKLLDAVALGRARARRLSRRPALPGYSGFCRAWWAYAIDEALRDVRSCRRAWTLPGLVAQVRRGLTSTGALQASANKIYTNHI